MITPAPLPVDPVFLAFQSAVAGRYSLDRELGRGGMGIVYLARDLALDRPVAIKLLPPTLAAVEELRARFLAEARTAARLSHPNVVPIFAVEETAGFVYFVMAYIAGGTLGDQLRKRGSLPFPNAARMLREVAWALDYAHGMGIIHRDVKPDNILIEEGSGRVMVADFGIAARSDAEVIGDGSVSGTTGFMSPEQATGAPVDGRSDLYALGVVGYLTLSGRMPDAGTPLARLAPQTPRALVQVVERCLAPRRDQRCASGREVADAVERSGSGELPPAIRMWLTRGQELWLPMTAWTLMIILPTVMGVLFMPGGPHNLAEFFLPLFIAWFPWLGITFWRTYQARRLLNEGYRLPDLQYALQIHSARRAEELSFQFGSGPTRLGKALRKIAFGGMAVCALIAFRYMTSPSSEILDLLFKIAAYAGAGSAVLGLAIPGRDLSRDRMLELRVRFWNGRLGKWMLRAAGVFQRGAVPPERALDRPTELALGHAAEVLFQALPEPARRDLAGLPETIARLSAQAAEFRKRMEELDGLRGDVRTNELEAGDALDQARALWKERFANTVGALETLRLGLLKVHNGIGDVQGLATDLANARTLVDRLHHRLAAQAEVEKISPSTSGGPAIQRWDLPSPRSS